MASEEIKDTEKKASPSVAESSTKEEGPPFSNYWRILSFGTRIEHVALIIATACAAASGVALPLMNIVFGDVVGDFNGFDAAGGAGLQDEFRSSISSNALFFVYLFIGKFVLTYIGMFCFRAAGLRISAAMRLSYLKALFSQPIKRLDEISTGTVANTITTSANEIQASVSDRLLLLFQSLALVIAAYGVAFRYSWALTLAVSAGIVFVILVLSLTTPFALKAIKRVAAADEQHATVASEALSSIRTVFALGAEQQMTDRHSRWTHASHDASMKLAKWMAIQLSPFYFATSACYALAFWFGLKLYRDGDIGSVSNVIIVFFSVLLVTTVVGQIAQPLMDVNKAIAASAGFFDMMDSDQVRSDGLKEPDVSAHEDIVFRDVVFAYPTRPDVKVLKGFSATIQKGKTTALVGPSGSGKSTIVALLERWYGLNDDRSKSIAAISDADTACESPTKEKPDNVGVDAISDNMGSITLGGTNVEDLDLKWWRSQIGLVQQEPFLFNDTIANNVAYGLIGTPWEDAEETKKLELVKEACIEAFADDFISKLSLGYSTKVGEGGIKLSGGQRQRVAIARCIVKKPAILILDEATSAIDVKGEQIVQQALDRASQDRTTIVIAHRLSTIRKADHIIVLRSGQKVEEGTHHDLLSLEDGLYSSLVRAQKIEEQEHQAEVTSDGDSVSEGKQGLTRHSTRKSFLDDDAEIAHVPTNEQQLPDTVSKKRGFRSIGALLYDQRARWYLHVITIAAAMGCGATYALQSWFFAQLIQAFQFTGQRLVDAANFWSLMFFILAIWLTICYSAISMSSGRAAAHIGTWCRQDYFSNALKMPIAYFDQEENASGSVMQRLSFDPKQVQDLLGINCAFPLISIFNVVGCVIISFYFGWKLTLVSFFAVIPVILGASFIRMRYEVQFEANNNKVFSTSSQFATEATGAFRTVSSLGMEHVVIAKYEKLLSDQIKTSTRKASYAMLIYALTNSIELCAMALTFWYGGRLLVSGEYASFDFFVIYSAIIQGSQAAGQYLSIIPNFSQAASAASRILELRSRVAKDKRPKGEIAITDESLGAKISFQDVTFRYPGGTAPLFSHLNITINPGQFVAFVGPSGCGKTTTISMLERFYDPEAGKILFDGQDISVLDTRTYRQKLALVSQEPRLFSGSIKDNLLIGKSGKAQEVTEQEMAKACKDAEIHDFIISLPQGYDTELGQNTQTALSGGQKQRLCLARALLRQPKLLLLDEATSSLDSQSEKLVQGAIESLAGQRSMTVIAVAHRLATIQKADTIFVFGERDVDSRSGSLIVESGSHSELLSKRGVYWSMCQAQALDR